MTTVIIESPFAGDVAKNLSYLKECIKDSLRRGEAPFASHLFYTQVLDDTISEERHLGMAAGFAWMAKADMVVVYHDLGISPGMEKGIQTAEKLDLPIEYRLLKNPSVEKSL